MAGIIGGKLVYQVFTRGQKVWMLESEAVGQQRARDNATTLNAGLRFRAQEECPDLEQPEGH